MLLSRWLCSLVHGLGAVQKGEMDISEDHETAERHCTGSASYLISIRVHEHLLYILKSSSFRTRWSRQVNGFPLHGTESWRQFQRLGG